MKQYFHAHVYFLERTQNEAMILQQAAMTFFDGISSISIGRLEVRLRGPHLFPMWEIQFSDTDSANVLNWLNENHGAFSVLIHKVTGDDIIDHLENVNWLGQELPLDHSKLLGASNPL